MWGKKSPTPINTFLKLLQLFLFNLFLRHLYNIISFIYIQDVMLSLFVHCVFVCYDSTMSIYSDFIVSLMLSFNIHKTLLTACLMSYIVHVKIYACTTWSVTLFMTECTLHAARWGQNLPKPSGGWMRRSSVTTSRCLILPLLDQRNILYLYLRGTDLTLS